MIRISKNMKNESFICHQLFVEMSLKSLSSMAFPASVWRTVALGEAVVVAGTKLQNPSILPRSN